MKILKVPPNKIKGFYGMNPEAAKHFHIKKYPKNTIEIDNRLGFKKTQEVIRHEQMEYHLMKDKHYSYVKADKIATKYEKVKRK